MPRGPPETEATWPRQDRRPSRRRDSREQRAQHSRGAPRPAPSHRSLTRGFSPCLTLRAAAVGALGQRACDPRKTDRPGLAIHGGAGGHGPRRSEDYSARMPDTLLSAFGANRNREGWGPHGRRNSRGIGRASLTWNLLPSRTPARDHGRQRRRWGAQDCVGRSDKRM